MQFPANDMMSGGDISHKISAHELQFPANNMMSGRGGEMNKSLSRKILTRNQHLLIQRGKGDNTNSR